jgi:predicted GNAT family N-acyltransferase
MPKPTIHVITDRKDYDKALAIRKAVFVKEQKVPVRIEVDEYEADCWHFILHVGNSPAGCARLRPVGRKLKLERIAVLKKFRGLGLGKLIVRHLVRFAKRKEPKEIYMNAQHYLIDFYSKLGFIPRGKVFDEAGISHIQMYLPLKK